VTGRKWIRHLIEKPVGVDYRCSDNSRNGDQVKTPCQLVNRTSTEHRVPECWHFGSLPAWLKAVGRPQPRLTGSWMPSSTAFSEGATTSVDVDEVAHLFPSPRSRTDRIAPRCALRRTGTDTSGPCPPSLPKLPRSIDVSGARQKTSAPSIWAQTPEVTHSAGVWRDRAPARCPLPG
jgi:hypothetical protein